VDGGSVSVPTFRFYDSDGKWAIENEGVSPDIEVIDGPTWSRAVSIHHW